MTESETVTGGNVTAISSEAYTKSHLAQFHPRLAAVKTRFHDIQDAFDADPTARNTLRYRVAQLSMLFTLIPGTIALREAEEQYKRYQANLAVTRVVSQPTSQQTIAEQQTQIADLEQEVWRLQLKIKMLEKGLT